MDSSVRAAQHCGMRTACVVAIAAVAFLSTGGAGVGAPASFQLVFDGRHNGRLHEGPFTASSSLCPSGTAADVSVDEQTLTALRRFSCDAGGDFTAKVRPLPAEHGGSGSWQIVAGTGPLADLRGKGSFTSVRLSGGPDPESITFRSTWKGVADFDVTPPTVGLRHWGAKKLKRPKGAYRVTLALALADSGGGPVSYVLQLVASRSVNFTQGRTATGSVTRSLRIKVGKHTRRVRLTIEASDAVGNQSSFAKTLRFKR
jgi:hypothetical protein